MARNPQRWMPPKGDPRPDPDQGLPTGPSNNDEPELPLVVPSEDTKVYVPQTTVEDYVPPVETAPALREQTLAEMELGKRSLMRQDHRVNLELEAGRRAIGRYQRG